MYLASVIVVVSVALMLLLWGGFMLWGFRSGQFHGADELSRLPLEETDERAEENRD